MRLQRAQKNQEAGVGRVQHPRLWWTEASANLGKEVRQRERARSTAASESDSPVQVNVFENVQGEVGQLKQDLKNADIRIARLENLEESLANTCRLGDQPILLQRT